MSEVISIEKHAKTTARELALQFLYQCECDRVYHFSEAHYAAFLQNFNVSSRSSQLMQPLVEGVMQNLSDIDTQIGSASQNWQLSRMSTTDRNALRIACYELRDTDTPPKVVMNEAVDLAKKFGSDQSGAFVNGVVDRLSSKLRTPS